MARTNHSNANRLPTSWRVCVACRSSRNYSQLYRSADVAVAQRVAEYVALALSHHGSPSVPDPPKSSRRTARRAQSDVR
ncbi:MAG TPA: hypothetical protein VEK56_06070, partial [Vicinamibacterales bacterium]|nr:hypothetical protein [Vicinamibacterales bacterium]